MSRLSPLLKADTQAFDMLDVLDKLKLGKKIQEAVWVKVECLAGINLKKRIV